MSTSSRCRFVVGTIDGKCVSYIVDQPVQPSAPSGDRPSTTPKEAPSYEHQSRPSTTAASAARVGSKYAEKSNRDAQIDTSVTLSNEQLDELMDILQQQRGRHLFVCTLPNLPFTQYDKGSFKLL